MDFLTADIPKFLKNSVKNRFQIIDPKDFENFIARLFKDIGYDVKQTQYSGDFGADLILEKDYEIIAVQVKRYEQDNKAGVKEVNQTIAGNYYYKCRKAYLITTSGFTNQAKEIASKTGIELWDWERLLIELSNVYWNGKDYYTYYIEELTDLSIDLSIDFKLKTISFEEQFILFNFIIQNLSTDNISINWIRSPIYINKFKRQFNNSAWVPGTFSGGTIYAGCNVEIYFTFPTNEINLIQKGEKNVIEYYQNNRNDLEKYFIHEIVSNYYKEKSHQIANQNTLERYYRKQQSIKFWIGLGKFFLYLVFGIFIIFFWVLSAALSEKK